MADRTLHKLSAKRVESEKEPGRYADGGGLYLQVQESATGGVTKSWLFRYTRASTAREMGLGPYPQVPLASSSTRHKVGDRVETIQIRGARDLAADQQRLLLAGVDPLAARKAARAGMKVQAGRAKTFKECAEAYIADHRDEWKNEKHAAQWENTLETYCYKAFGDMPVAMVGMEQILGVLKPLWKKKTETASRLRGRIEKILEWAAADARKYREGANPARWDNLKSDLPKKSKIAPVEHHPALPYKDAAAFLVKLREQLGIAARALEFTILTAGRTGEVIGAPWDEIDLDARTWTVPGERMKGGRPHRVPLCERALAILREAKEANGDFVFPGRKGDALSNMACLKVLERMARDDLTVHGFRSTFRDWAGEETSFPRDVIEMALAHRVAGKTEEAYWRGDLFEKRRRLMEAWAQYLAKPPAEKEKGKEKVTPIHAAKHR